MHINTTCATWGCRLAAAAVITLGALLPATLNAAEKILAITPEQAGPDFLVQGEYVGEITRAGQKRKYAAQVAAMGNGAFHAVFLAGGLPGEGWDGKTTITIDGKTEGDKTSFIGKDFSAEIKGDTLGGSHPPEETFTLKKVMRRSPTEGAKAPAGAIVLFDGTNTDEWERGVMDLQKRLIVDLPKEFQSEGFIDNRENVFVGPGPTTKRKFKNFTLHLEFIQPYKPQARGQSRGNSGVYIQHRYELQILDSFGFNLNNKKAAGDLAGEIYAQKVPDVSMSYPPLSWQTYDIDFEAAQFDAEGKRTKKAVITLKHNGVTVHDKHEITNNTGAGKPESAKPGPIVLQNHGNPVFFRNIWIVETQ
jgi:hypothetical protein